VLNHPQSMLNTGVLFVKGEKCNLGSLVGLSCVGNILYEDAEDISDLHSKIKVI